MVSILVFFPPWAFCGGRPGGAGSRLRPARRGEAMGEAEGDANTPALHAWGHTTSGEICTLKITIRAVVQ